MITYELLLLDWKQIFSKAFLAFHLLLFVTSSTNNYVKHIQSPEHANERQNKCFGQKVQNR